MYKTDVIFLVVLSVIGLAIPAVIVCQHFVGMDVLALLQLSSGRTVVGSIFTILAILVCLLNFYLTFLNPWLYRIAHGSMEDYGSMSGLPLVGSIFIVLAGALMPGSVILGIFLLILYAIDGNGIPWVFISILRYGI